MTFNKKKNGIHNEWLIVTHTCTHPFLSFCQHRTQTTKAKNRFLTQTKTSTATIITITQLFLWNFFLVPMLIQSNRRGVCVGGYLIKLKKLMKTIQHFYDVIDDKDDYMDFDQTNIFINFQSQQKQERN